MSEERLERMEGKIDGVVADLSTIKETLAEQRGARKAVFAFAGFLGALAGLIVTYFTGRH